MRVIIVGGGIGGLSAAIALRRDGHEPVVLERATRLEAVGAGITLFANAMDALSQLGVAARQDRLLGDAAHATTPGNGQGAAMATEDATALADELSTGAALPASLARYAAIRRPRTELVLKLSRRVDRTGQLSGAVSTRLRNLLVSRTPPRLQARDLEPIIHHPIGGDTS